MLPKAILVIGILASCAASESPISESGDNFLVRRLDSDSSEVPSHGQKKSWAEIKWDKVDWDNFDWDEIDWEGIDWEQMDLDEINWDQKHEWNQKQWEKRKKHWEDKNSHWDDRDWERAKKEWDNKKRHWNKKDWEEMKKERQRKHHEKEDQGRHEEHRHHKKEKEDEDEDGGILGIVIFFTVIGFAIFGIVACIRMSCKKLAKRRRYSEFQNQPPFPMSNRSPYSQAPMGVPVNQGGPYPSL